MGYNWSVSHNPITPMESKDKEKGRIYCARDTLRPSMSELVVSLSASQHDYHTLENKGRVKV